MFKKLAILTTIFLLLTTMGVGCKGLTAEQQAAVKPVKLTYWTIYNDVEQLRQLASEYKQVRPYVTVEVRQIRYEEFDTLFSNALADDLGPDIVSMYIRWLRQYYNRLSPMPAAVNVARVVKKGKYTDEIEVIIDTNNMPTDRDIKSQYVSSVYENATVGGKVYGLPLAVDSLAVFYNKDLLDKANIPEPPKDWDEFVEAVKKTTKFNSNGDIVQAGTALGTVKNIDVSFDLLSLFMMQSGVQMSSGNAITFSSGLTNPEPSHPAFKALQFYTDFARPTKEIYTWNDQMENALTEFVRGKVVFYFGYAYDLPRIRARAPQMNLEVLPMFQLSPDDPKNIANYWLESVVKKSKHQDEAWDFVRFIASAQNVKKYTEAVLRPSPYRAHIAEQQENVQLAPFASQSLFAQNWYRGRNVDVATDAFNDLITEYLAPYNTNKPLERDARLLINAATRVQQTM